MRNLYEQFRALVPEPPLQAGTVIDAGAGVVTVQLPGGGLVKARGRAETGQTVFARDGLVEAVAPSLPIVLIDL
jgi:hypothetical protein